MPIVTLTIGIPASGKSTWAKAQATQLDDVVIVCRDDIRHGHGWPFGVNEDRVTKIHRNQIEAALAAGMDVIVADTNINKHLRKGLIAFCHRLGADVAIKTIPVTKEEAIRRDDERVTHRIGAAVISKFHDQLQSQDIKDEYLPVQSYAPYVHSGSKQRVVCVDIDGTVAEHNRSPYDYSKVSTDSPVYDIIDVVEVLSTDYRILFVSGRPESCRSDTQDWLTKNITTYQGRELHMRETDDKRPDWVVKNEIYDRDIIPYYDVTLVLDDRDQVVRHLRKRGLTVVQVAEGRF